MVVPVPPDYLCHHDECNDDPSIPTQQPTQTHGHLANLKPILCMKSDTLYTTMHITQPHRRPEALLFTVRASAFGTQRCGALACSHIQHPRALSQTQCSKRGAQPTRSGINNKPSWLQQASTR